MRKRFSSAVLTLACALAACGGDTENGAEPGAEMSGLSGTITVDGSSTVFLITEATAEEFGLATNGGVQVTVGMSGTGGGFKRFCAGETEISNASRPIKDTETALCQQNGIEYVDFQVAIDGLAVLVNPQNTFVQCLTVDELKKVWAPGSTVARWSDVRAGLPAEPVKLYGPGTNSGTFDYFTEAIVGEAGASRGDYTASEDDNVLVQGVAGDKNALGYFGYAYFAENRDKVKAIAVDGGSGCIEPSPETVKGGQYSPLSRPLFIYVAKSALARPEVAAYVRFYLEHAPELVPQVGYIPLEAAQYQQNLSKLPQGGAS